jgi:hypothetical protein
MNFDLYYANKEQDKYGREQKTWQLDQTLIGYAETIGAEDKSKTFFEYKGKLLARTKLDPRISINAQQYPLTDILITDIRDRKNHQEFYLETFGERSGKSTLYEISALEPYIDPFNRIEYYRLFLNRLDAQVLNTG